MTVPCGSRAPRRSPARRARGSSGSAITVRCSSGSSFTAASRVSRVLGRRAATPRGTGPRPPRRLLRRRAQREVRAPAGRAAAVARLVGDDLQQPGPERRARAEAAERAPRLDEAVLRGLLGVGGVAGDHVGRAEGDALVCVHELLVGVRVAALRAADQVGFVEWSAHHRPLLHRSTARSSRSPCPRSTLKSCRGSWG